MRKFTVVALLFNLVLAGTSGPFVVLQSATVSKDCAMCGGVCCCPELCKPAVKDNAIDACHSGAAVCSLTKERTPAESLQIQSLRFKATQMTLIGHAPLVGSSETRSESILFFIRACIFLDQPTPPPRIA